MSDTNKAFIEATECWLRKQSNNKKRNIEDIAMTKEQMILDDKVTRTAIVDFNAWAKENGEVAIVTGLRMNDHGFSADTIEAGTISGAVADIAKRVQSIEHMVDGMSLRIKPKTIDIRIDGKEVKALWDNEQLHRNR